MRKIIILVIGFMLLFISSFTFANTGEIIATGSIVTDGVIESTGSIENMSYTYYYGQGCSHCENVDKYMKGVDGYNKVNIVKKEIYFDDANRAEYLEAGKRLGISEADLGIPFLIINNGGKEDFLIGDETIISHFKGYLGEAPENPYKGIILIILGVLVVLVPVVLIKLSNKN